VRGASSSGTLLRKANISSCLNHTEGGVDLGLVHPVNVSRGLRTRNLFSLPEPAFQIPLPVNMAIRSQPRLGA
jgi:hypothetical protein